MVLVGHWHSHSRSHQDQDEARRRRRTNHDTVPVRYVCTVGVPVPVGSLVFWRRLLLVVVTSKGKAKALCAIVAFSSFLTAVDVYDYDTWYRYRYAYYRAWARENQAIGAARGYYDTARKPQMSFWAAEKAATVSFVLYIVY